VPEGGGAQVAPEGREPVAQSFLLSTILGKALVGCPHDERKPVYPSRTEWEDDRAHPNPWTQAKTEDIVDRAVREILDEFPPGRLDPT
jgi:hypothetical protein